MRLSSLQLNLLRSQLPVGTATSCWSRVIFRYTLLQCWPVIATWAKLKVYVPSLQCTMAWYGTGWQSWYWSDRYPVSESEGSLLIQQLEIFLCSAIATYWKQEAPSNSLVRLKGDVTDINIFTWRKNEYLLRIKVDLLQAKWPRTTQMLDRRKVWQPRKVRFSHYCCHNWYFISSRWNALVPA